MVVAGKSRAKAVLCTDDSTFLMMFYVIDTTIQRRLTAVPLTAGGTTVWTCHYLLPAALPPLSDMFTHPPVGTWVVARF